MTTTVRVIADSYYDHGVRLTTLQLKYPRFIHPEFLTHRVFSRNASSSRATPVERIIESLERDPVRPCEWGKNRPGMQAHEIFDPLEVFELESLWIDAMAEMVRVAKNMVARGVHKSIVNRLLEPWSHINVIVTSTEWSNFEELRCHPDAAPEMQELAQAIRDEMVLSGPQILHAGEWHIPYVNLIERSQLNLQAQLKISVARCARVSFLTHEGKVPQTAKDLELYDRLVGAKPLHASPSEHQATPDPTNAHCSEHGNFRGWRQFRKILEKDSTLLALQQTAIAV
jgi:thymidylate synthase ThyX